MAGSGMGGMAGGGMGGMAGGGTGGMAGTAGASMGGTAGTGMGGTGMGGMSGGGSTGEGGAGEGGEGGTGGVIEFCGSGPEITGEEECEPPGSAYCSDDCKVVSNPQCLACEQGADCAEFVVDDCTDQVGIAPNGASRPTNCYDALECMRDSLCGATGSITECYCGTLPTAQCVAAPNSGAGAPNGACKEIIEDALETESPQTVLTRFTNTFFAGGWAISRVTCAKTLCFSQCFPTTP
jgi:hypothetical protein